MNVKIILRAKLYVKHLSKGSFDLLSTISVYLIFPINM